VLLTLFLAGRAGLGQRPRPHSPLAGDGGRPTVNPGIGGAEQSATVAQGARRLDIFELAVATGVMAQRPSRCW
jgi:hypothetical protein